MDLSRLTKSVCAWFHLLAAESDAARDTLSTLERKPASRVAVHFVRGRKSETTTAFFDELSAALQFPDYFGENWDATNDCLGDLAWIHADAIVLGLLDGDKLLAAAGTAEEKKLFKVLTAAVEHVNHATAKKPGRSFHLVVQASAAEADAVAQRWAGLGLKLARIK